MCSFIIVLWTHSNFERDAPRFKVEVKGPTVYTKITHTHISRKAAYLMMKIHSLLLGSLMPVLYNKELSSVTDILHILYLLINQTAFLEVFGFLIPKLP